MYYFPTIFPRLKKLKAKNKNDYQGEIRNGNGR